MITIDVLKKIQQNFNFKVTKILNTCMECKPIWIGLQAHFLQYGNGPELPRHCRGLWDNVTELYLVLCELHCSTVYDDVKVIST